MFRHVFRAASVMTPALAVLLLFGGTSFAQGDSSSTAQIPASEPASSAATPPAVGPAGPAMAVPRPAVQCPQTAACTYQERSDASTNYLFQALEVCGADCSTQFWVSDLASDQDLLDVPPIAGGGIVAVSRARLASTDRAQVRTVLPQFSPSDPTCCPSSYIDVTYGWDASGQTLVPAATVTIASANFNSWVAQRSRLQADGFVDVFVAPS